MTAGSSEGRVYVQHHEWGIYGLAKYCLGQNVESEDGVGPHLTVQVVADST